MTKVFIDGSAGTTGLRIHERLNDRKDLELVTLPDEVRKDPEARKSALNGCDVAFLCLPDAAAVEAVEMIENPSVCVIDTSTAHRTNSDFTYGFPELSGKREAVKSSKRIANPGCHASGFVALVAPLTENGLISPETRLSAFSLTGYSGGGKTMIAQYNEDQDPFLTAPRVYGLTQNHKHLKEMVHVCGLERAPIFSPIVAPFYSGMEVSVSLFGEDLKGSVKDICDLYASYYENGLVRFVPNADENGFMSAAAFTGRDDMQITLCGNEDRITLVARFDNLGKGASGAAIQNMNIVLGVDETLGLNV